MENRSNEIAGMGRSDLEALAVEQHRRIEVLEATVRAAGKSADAAHGRRLQIATMWNESRDNRQRADHVFRRVIQRSSEDDSWWIAIEECAELFVAICHYRRGRSSQAYVIEEVADALVAVGKLRVMVGAEEVDEVYRAKVERLREKFGIEY